MADSFESIPASARKEASNTLLYVLLGGAALAGVAWFLTKKEPPLVAGPDNQTRPLPPPSVPAPPSVPEMTNAEKVLLWRQLASAQLENGSAPNTTNIIGRTPASNEATTSALRDIVYRNRSVAETTADAQTVTMSAPNLAPAAAQPGKYVLVSLNGLVLWFATLDEIKNEVLTASKNYRIFLKPDEWSTVQALAGAPYAAVLP
jgi:hypothetical protein